MLKKGRKGGTRPKQDRNRQQQQNRDAGHPPNRVCGCSLKTAGIIVAFVEFLLCILAVYGLIRNLYYFGVAYLFWFIVGIISILIILIAIVLLLYAIKKESSRLLIPHLSAQIFLIGWLIIVVIVVTLLLIFGAYRGIRRLLGTGDYGDYYMSDEGTRWLGFWIIAVYLAIALLELFFLYIIWKLYQYFREYSKLSGGPATYTSVWGKSKKSGGPVHEHPPANGEWFKLPPNDRAYGGSPEAGDIYPYEPPVV